MPFYTRRRTYFRISSKKFKVVNNKTGDVKIIDYKQAQRIFRMTKTKQVINQIAKRKHISYNQAKKILQKIKVTNNWKLAY
jgi:hypothetical protein